MTDPPARWSLRGEIKKRRTREILRAIEARTVQTPSPVQLRRSAPPIPTTPQPSALPKRITQTYSANKRATQLARSVVYTTRWTKQQRRTALLATILVVAICMVTTLVATSQPVLRPALPPLPTAVTNDLISYLREVGVPIAGVRTFSVPNALWNAKEEIQFEVYRGSDKGIFVVLNYDSPARAGIDAFKATYHQKFKTWGMIQVSNILVLSSPDTVQSFSAEIASHLTQYLVAPYRTFIPSATPGERSYSFKIG